MEPGTCLMTKTETCAPEHTVPQYTLCTPFLVQRQNASNTKPCKRDNAFCDFLQKNLQDQHFFLLLPPFWEEDFGPGTSFYSRSSNTKSSYNLSGTVELQRSSMLEVTERLRCTVWTSVQKRTIFHSLFQLFGRGEDRRVWIEVGVNCRGKIYTHTHLIQKNLMMFSIWHLGVSTGNYLWRV